MTEAARLLSDPAGRGYVRGRAVASELSVPCSPVPQGGPRSCPRSAQAQRQAPGLPRTHGGGGRGQPLLRSLGRSWKACLRGWRSEGAVAERTAHGGRREMGETWRQTELLGAAVPEAPPASTSLFCRPVGGCDDSTSGRRGRVAVAGCAAAAEVFGERMNARIRGLQGDDPYQGGPHPSRGRLSGKPGCSEEKDLRLEAEAQQPRLGRQPGPQACRPSRPREPVPGHTSPGGTRVAPLDAPLSPTP